MAAALPQLVDLDRLITDAADMRPLPQTVMRLSAILASDGWDLKSIVDTLKLDPPLTAKLLRVANSAAYSPAQPISEVRRAVMHLGASQVASLAMGFAVRADLDQAIPAFGIREGELWKHAVAAALTAELCGRYCSKRVPAEAYVTALLHDIGKLVLARHLDGDCMALLRRAHEDGKLDSLGAEREVLSVHHGELGALIVQRWGLPESIAKGIMYHHNPAEAEPAECVPLAQVACLSDIVAKKVGATLGADPLPSAEFQHALRLGLGMTEDQFIALTERVSAKLDEVLACYE